MNKKLRNALQYLFFFSLGFFFVWLSVKDIDDEKWQHIRFALSNTRYYLVAPVFLILVASHYFRALRWRLLIQSLGYTPSRFNTFFSVFVGYLVNQGVPRMGEVVKCTVLGRYDKIPPDKLIGTIILERLIDAITLLLVFGITLAIQPGLYQRLVEEVFVSDGKPGKAGISGGQIFLIVVGALLLLAIGWAIVKKKTLADIKNILKGIAGKIWQGVGAIRHLRKRGLFLLLTVCMWACYLAGGLIGFQALEQTQQYGIKESFTVLSAGSIGMVVTPGGIGGYPLLVEKTMILYDLQPEIATAFGWLLWIAQTVIIIFGGAISFAVLPWYNRRRDKRRRQQSAGTGVAPQT
ncbi:MAG: flippase-like domain-containing protein [Chitinophagaceae bacterium]|nr:MAG: flippase-like domain-containing protein [Chitinophagaceae bacterium]